MIATACALTPSSYLLLYLYGLVCIGIGFAVGVVFTSPRWRPGARQHCGHQPIDRGQGEPSAPPPRKP